jgi:alkaline phosphatase D
VCVPDNHDGRDGSWDDADFVDGAMRTFFERMPVRRDPADPDKVHGSFRWGTLFELWMLDCRRYRTEVDESTFDSSTEHGPWDPARTMLGADQKEWLKDGLVASTAAWRVIGSSLMFSPTRLADSDDAATRGPDDVPNGGLYVNGGQWDGYQVERREILQHLVDHGVEDTVVLSGDMHWFAAGDGQLDTDDPASPRVYAEFVGGSVTSAAAERFPLPSGGKVTPIILGVVRAANSQLIRFFDVDRHGHGELRLAREGVDVDFVSPTTITAPGAPVEVLASFRLDAGNAPMQVTKGAQW